MTPPSPPLTPTQSSNPSPALPLDILTTIIEDLSPSIPSDLHSIRSLALSSKLLTPLCQRVIFKRVDLRNRHRRRYKPGSGTSLIKSFADLVSSESSKHIGTYVLHLSYQAQDADIPDGTLSQLSTILSSLTALRSLHFSWVVPGNRTFDFNTLTTDPDPSTNLFRDALDAQLRSEHLLQVTIPNMRNFPFGVFVDKAAVVDLVEEAPFSVQLSVVSLKATPEISSCIPVRQYALGSISWPRRILDVNLSIGLGVGGKVYLRPPSVGIPPLDVSATKSALICVKEQINVVEAEKVIRCAKGGIEELSYEVTEASWFRGLSHALLSSPGSSSSSNTGPSSPSLSLTTLELSHTSDSDPDPLSHITEELALLSSSSPSPSSSSPSSTLDAPHVNTPIPHLHTLSLALALSLTHAPLSPSSLNKLDELLSDTRRFPGLKTLSLEITILKRGSWDENLHAPTGDEGGAASPPPASPPPSESESDDPEGIEAADANANADASETPADTLPVGALDFQEADQRQERLSQAHHQRRVLRVLDDLKAKHLASLPRLVGMQNERVVEVHYSSVLREMYDDDEDEDDGYTGFQIWD